MIFLISSLQQIRNWAAGGSIGDPHLVGDTRARLAEGSPRGTINDVRDPHSFPQAKPCGSIQAIPTTTTTVASDFEMAGACSAE